MKLTMRLSERSYDIVVKRGSLGHIGQLVNLNRKVLIVTDSGVPQEYAETVAQQCKEPFVETVRQGEQSKSIAVWQRLLSRMMSLHFGRGDAVVAVGGGVVGDLAGFVAASYMRGVDFINIPTTTLAQIDSSIGGKTALNLEHTKNIVGAFWQPKLVLIDPNTLKTLPKRHFAAGLAEAVKAGLLADSELLRIFEEENCEEFLEQILYRSLIVKKNIVEHDERESGERAALNLGHTLGHAIESATALHRKHSLYHGECVALGMLPMIEDNELKQRVKTIYQKLGLPLCAEFDKETALQALRHDKKVQDNQLTVVKIPKAAAFRLDKVPFELAERVLMGQAEQIPAPEKEKEE